MDLVKKLAEPRTTIHDNLTRLQNHNIVRKFSRPTNRFIKQNSQYYKIQLIFSFNHSHTLRGGHTHSPYFIFL